MTTSPIGGYFQLELPHHGNPFSNSIKLNSGRASLAYICHAKNINSIWIPRYTCGDLTNYIINLGITVKFYSIDSSLRPVIPSGHRPEDAFLAINYFGLCDDRIADIHREITSNLVVDNCQALFTTPIPGVPTFYSPRKFVGLPDGGLVNGIENYLSLELDSSISRCEHLLGRLDSGPEHFFAAFHKAEYDINCAPPMKMSLLTTRLLESIDYSAVIVRRRSNFNTLKDLLKSRPRLEMDLTDSSVPLCYPYLSTHLGIRESLTKHRVYIPQYWASVLSDENCSLAERHLAEHLLPLPIDQRYNDEDMEHVADLVLRAEASMHGVR